MILLALGEEESGQPTAVADREKQAFPGPGFKEVRLAGVSSVLGPPTVPSLPQQISLPSLLFYTNTGL